MLNKEFINQNLRYLILFILIVFNMFYGDFFRKFALICLLFYLMGYKKEIKTHKNFSWVEVINILLGFILINEIFKLTKADYPFKLMIALIISTLFQKRRLHFSFYALACLLIGLEIVLVDYFSIQCDSCAFLLIFMIMNIDYEDRHKIFKLKDR